MTKVMSASLLVAAVLAATLLPSAGGQAQSSAPASVPNEGAKLYQAKCGGCHSIAASKIGPAHKGVFGRKAGMVAGYKYSPALRAAKVTWDAKTLDLWLQDPQKLVKGSRMYLVVPDPAQRAAIINYLQSDAVR